MSHSDITANERSWEIDVITHINIRLRNHPCGIGRAGGEHSVRTSEPRGTESYKGPFFPDVLLFGTPESGAILHGWELKFPDTPITDNELIEKAVLKANLLQTNSFLVWNVNEATLYRKRADGDGAFVPFHSWRLEGADTTRETVDECRDRWKSMLDRILDDLDGFFARGEISPSSVRRIMEAGTLYETISPYITKVSDFVTEKCRENQNINALVDGWWKNCRDEHPGDETDMEVFSRMIFTTWFNRIIFCHILKRHYAEARRIDTVTERATQEEVKFILQKISEHCDFLNILQPSIEFDTLPDIAWNAILEVNRFLSDCSFEMLDVTVLHDILSFTINVAKRKLAGQYATPEKLASILIKTSLIERDWVFLDPCCGSGTIPRVAYLEKTSRGIPGKNALSRIWAGDKFAFPVSIATMGVTFPENMGEIVRVFRSDASEIAPGRAIVVKNPSTGKDETLVFPLFDCIVSNLPFVRTEDAGELNTELMASTRDVLSEYDRSLSIERKSDLYAYFPFHLWKSLRVDGIFTFISSNSWLGSKWGRVFFNILSRFFIIDTVIASGNGRWFDNADVVTTATRLRRRRVPIIGDIPNDEPTTFVLTEKQLGEYSEDEIETLSLAIIRRESEDGICVSTTWTGEEIRKIESVGMSLNTLFFDLAPALRLFEAKKNEQNLLVSANSVFDFFRGERRGWNEFFYPENHEEIEDVYIKPILKKSRNISGLVAEPDCNGFFCSVSEENLESLGHTGVLSHIRSFENRRNGKGKLLKDVLTLPGCFWYEMRSAHQVDIVALMNYDRRLFFAATPNVSCIDQRFIGMSRLHETTSAPLCHALLNSLPGLFYIEALGFGRGLGVLDLSKERVENGLYMLNPLALDKEEQARILEAFAPLLERNVLALDDELRMDDRLAFDSVVAEVYGIPQGIFVQLRKTLLSMYHVRHSVNQ